MDCNDDFFSTILTAVGDTSRSLREDPNFLKPLPPDDTSKSLRERLFGTDDDDDEDEELSDFGKSVNALIQSQPTDNAIPSELSTVSAQPATWTTKPKPPRAPNQLQPLQAAVTTQHLVPAVKHDVYTDPIFGIRIIRPLISSTAFKSKMEGRCGVAVCRLREFVDAQPNNTDWVVAGVLVHKTGRTSQQGNPFSIWTLSDLHGDLKTFALFLFQSAYKALWKCELGTVVSVLNPSVLERKQGSKDEATLSIDNVQKLMILGHSKDFGTCKSTKKDGSPCTAFVNTSRCEHCIYHVKQEYQKCSSRRSDLQSSFTGRGLQGLHNKVLGKHEVFYAGKSYTAQPAKSCSKLRTKDVGRLNALSGLHQQNAQSPQLVAKSKRPMVQHVEESRSRRLKDLHLLQKLGNSNESRRMEPSQDVSIAESRCIAKTVISKLQDKQPDNNEPCRNKEKENSVAPTLALVTPKLSSTSTSMIDLSSTVMKKTRALPRANQKALQWVQHNGPINKIDPNSTKHISKKRSAASTTTTTSPEAEESDAKRRRTGASDHFSQRFKQMMAATSAHSDLLEVRDGEKAEEYFAKLEAKERMEEKMTSTMQVACKAVQCTQCKYTSFSAADRCKTERHPLKVFDAVKRFFACADCGYRTVSLNKLPTNSCKKCKGSRWQRTGMMKDKTVAPVAALSVRGDEQTFSHSHAQNANLSLLVPDNDDDN